MIHLLLYEGFLVRPFEKKIFHFGYRDIVFSLTQLFLSLLLLWLFVSSFQHENILESILECSFEWLGIAVCLKSISLFLREIRLWMALPTPRPQLLPTMLIGLFTGALHTFLPMRGGDILSVALLHKKLNISIPKATFAVGFCAFLEMFVFGVLAIITLLMTQHLWFHIHDLYTEILSWISLSTGLGVVIFALAVLLARIKAPEPEEESPSLLQSMYPQILQMLRNSVVSRKYIIYNILLTIADVCMMLLSFACIFNCLHISCDLPFTVSTLILGISAVAAFALPPSYGAGPAASAILVFSLFQLSEEDAIAYAAIWWVLSQFPSLLFGIPSLWLMKFFGNADTNKGVDAPSSSS